jgi:hypothetical protein
VTLAQDPTEDEGIVCGVLDAAKQKLTISVFGVDGTTAGVAATKVAWLAVGK